MRKCYRFRCQRYFFKSLKTKEFFFITFICQALALMEEKQNKAITNDSMYKHKSYTPRNNLLFVARTPQT